MGQISGVSTSDLNNVDGFFTSQTGGGGGGGTISTIATMSFSSEQFSAGEITITNSASYSDLSIFCQIKSGSTVVVPNSSMSLNEATGKITYTDIANEASRSIELTVQEFGEASSSVATGSYKKNDANFRYWRLIYNAQSSATHTYLKDFRLYDDLNQSGTGYPSNMTSNVLPSPYSASGNYVYNSTYDYYKAFDNNVGSGWWTIGSSTAGKFINIDFGSAKNIKSTYIRFNRSYTVATNLSVIGSNNADYSNSVAFVDSASVADTQNPIFEIELN